MGVRGGQAAGIDAANPAPGRLRLQFHALEIAATSRLDTLTHLD
jgi:hypothetical protein